MNGISLLHIPSSPISYSRMAIIRIGLNPSHVREHQLIGHATFQQPATETVTQQLS